MQFSISPRAALTVNHPLVLCLQVNTAPGKNPTRHFFLAKESFFFQTVILITLNQTQKASNSKEHPSCSDQMCTFGNRLLFPTGQRTKNLGLCTKEERRQFCERQFSWHWMVSSSGFTGRHHINLDFSKFPSCLWQLLPLWLWKECVKLLPRFPRLEGCSARLWGADCAGLFGGLVHVFEVFCKSQALARQREREHHWSLQYVPLRYRVTLS